MILSVLCGSVFAAISGAGLVIVSFAKQERIPAGWDNQRLLLRSAGVLLLIMAAFIPMILTLRLS